MIFLHLWQYIRFWVVTNGCCFLLTSTIKAIYTVANIRHYMTVSYIMIMKGHNEPQEERRGAVLERTPQWPPSIVSWPQTTVSLPLCSIETYIYINHPTNQVFKLHFEIDIIRFVKPHVARSRLQSLKVNVQASEYHRKFARTLQE